MVYGENDLNSGLNSAAANFFGGALRDRTDRGCASSKLRSIAGSPLIFLALIFDRDPSLLRPVLAARLVPPKRPGAAILF